MEYLVMCSIVDLSGEKEQVVWIHLRLEVHDRHHGHLHPLLAALDHPLLNGRHLSHQRQT